MKILICTHAHLDKPSAGINRMRRMCHALGLHGIKASIAGPANEVDGVWQAYPGPGEADIAYRLSAKKIWRHSQALRSGSQAAYFFQNYLPSILRNEGYDGVIAYGPMGHLIEGMRLGARESGKFIVADQVERYRFSVHYLLNGIYWQQAKLCNSVLPKLDGLIGISKGWVDWAQTKGIPSVWIPSFAEDHGAVRQGPSKVDRPFTLTFVGHWIDRIRGDHDPAV